VADAHALVVRDALTHLQAGARVVVANTHVRLWEMAGIIGAATITQHSFCIVEFIGRYGNIHSVPEEVILGMGVRWESAIDDWTDRVFFVEKTT
jgi:hypothetical protein